MLGSDIFRDYRKTEEVSFETFKEYGEKIPNELLDVWKKYGFGQILDGYIRIINPQEYVDVLKDSYGKGNSAIPIMTTAFGDIITWEDNRYIKMICYKDGLLKVIGAGFKFFFSNLMDEAYQKDYFDLKLYKDAKEIYGEAGFDECYGFVPLLGLGGKRSAEKLKIVKMKEHIGIITQLVGGIE